MQITAALHYRWLKLQAVGLMVMGRRPCALQRVARAKSETKIQARRAQYDDGLVRAQMMALSIAGMARYPGYDGIDAQSYGRGDLDHAVAERAVFASDPRDDHETDAAFWGAARAAVDAGATLPGWLRRQGWDDARIADVVAVPVAVPLP